MRVPSESRSASRFAGFVLWGLVLLAAAVFTRGITWGLPSRNSDVYLFGGRPAWPGERIAGLVKPDRRRGDDRGADVDVDPVVAMSQPVLLNATDEEQAAILLRYRLYTAQPDEMVTLMALASMRPGQGDFDPRLYQYGGLFVYPIGALLEAGSRVGLVRVTTDLRRYLDHPEEFARFYVVARSYVVAFAVAGVPAVFWLARRISAALAPPPHGIVPWFAGLIAALLYVLMPVVINTAHEAKPHLPGAVIMLYAVLAAMRYAERPGARRAAVVGLLCGASLGMVLTGWPIFVVPPLMALLCRDRSRNAEREALVACGIGVAAYFATNPYVLKNLLVNRGLLWSNVENTAAVLAPPGWSRAPIDAVRLLAEGASPLLLAAGAAAVVALCVLPAVCRRGARNEGSGKAGQDGGPLQLLLAPAALVLAQFAILAADKPAEYVRFGLFPSIALAVFAAVAVWRIRPDARPVSGLLALALVAMTAMRGAACLDHFVADSRGPGTRIECARHLADLVRRRGPLSIGVFATPAPYCVPPLDVARCRLYLLPRYPTAESPIPLPDVIVATDEEAARSVRGMWASQYAPEWPDPSATPTPVRMCWANKPFVLWSRKAPADPAGPVTSRP